MTDNYDVIIIGAGHNGLTCGCYLAKAGLKVLLLERRHVVGGAAVSEQVFPGFTFSVYSYVSSQLHPKIVNDLALPHFGLRSFGTDRGLFRPVDDKRSIIVKNDVAETQRSMARFSERDARRYPEFLAYLSDALAVVHSLKTQTPIDIGGSGWTNLRKNVGFLWKYRKTQNTIYKLLDLFTQSSEDYLSRWFESSEVKATFAFAVGGSLVGPKTVGSAWLALHGGGSSKHGKDNDKVAISGQVVGGMGAITQAMAKCAEHFGANIALNSEVSRIETRNGRVTAVLTADGREYRAGTVVGNLHAKLLFDDLVGAEHLPSDFMDEIRRFRTQGAAFKLNIACDAPPRFSAFQAGETRIDYPPFIQIAPTMEYLNQAYEDAEPGWYSSRPSLIVTVPTCLEPALAPEGKHIVQIYGGHACYRLNKGSWLDERENFLKTVLNTVNEFAPGFCHGVIGTQLLLPEDIESELNVPNGHINHGDMTIDQMFFKRPAAHYADYRSPIRGLYQCGASTHPGGGVSGVPGHNAAREVLRDLRRRSV